MKLSISTASLLVARGQTAVRDTPEVMEQLCSCGFEAMDVSFCLHDRENYILGREDWQHQVERIGDTAARQGVELYQSHLPFVSKFAMSVNHKFRESGYREYFDECVRRACVANGMLGIKWSVAHPLSFPELNFERSASLEANRDYYAPFAELCIKNGTGIAFENAVPSLKRDQPVRYCQHYEELAELCDSYDDDQVGICWDTGHANQMKLDQGRAIRVLGGRIKCLHLNDNHYGTRDEHLLPYMGEVDWDAVIRALVETGYDGTLNYETVAVTRTASPEYQDHLMRATVDNGQLLRKQFEQIRLEISR